ncbi:DUF4469 domain-containing protein [Labilibacter sediminis]|nr:DUF4469 domain-containing protein [Labilibacter sediminis]
MKPLLNKVEITSPRPVLQQFIDLKNKVTNESCTLDHITSIKGSLFKFDPDDRNQGIYFIAADGTETKVTNVVKPAICVRKPIT